MIAEEDRLSEEGENYFISMTDMMVGVLFIFIIMLMTFALDFRRSSDVQQDALKIAQQIAEKLRAQELEVQKQIAAIQQVAEDRRRLLHDIQAQLAREGLKVEVDDANGVLRLTEDAVRFQPSHSDLIGHYKENVDKIARVLGRILPRHVACLPKLSVLQNCDGVEKAKVETLFIEGHTDTTGADTDNWQLSTARAVNTYRELITTAPILPTLRNSASLPIVSVSGYSSTRPIDPHNDKGAWEKNRRIDLRFVMETDNLTGLQQIRDMTREMDGEIERLKALNGGGP
ncbi:MAG: OmpA family protein [Hyphomicrobiales bacterium]|nr:OmpA family protein [Hyphomicrobiales bacterium]MDE2114770.1 OmpA family protein [Hyphomicrobiales bacterium]